MLELRRYIAGDAGLVTPRADLINEAGAMDRAFLDGRAVPPGEAWTLTDRLEPIACGGLAPVWPGRFIAWTWIGTVRPRHWPVITRLCARGLTDAFEAGARRIEATTPVRLAAGAAWLERLGFAREGLARAYGPAGDDYWLYARTS